MLRISKQRICCVTAIENLFGNYLLIYLLWLEFLHFPRYQTKKKENSKIYANTANFWDRRQLKTQKILVTS